MADLGNLHFGVHLKDYTDAEADKIKNKLENLSVKLTIDGKNVNISHTDLIKKQIEDAVKSVSVQSVKVDTSAVKTQVANALQGVNPQISVTLLNGSLGNDLQNYLNSRTFNVGISISKSDAQNAARTAFANVSVPVSVTISASAVAQQMRQSLGNVKVKVGVEAKGVNAFIADVEKKLEDKKIKVDVEPNQQHLVQAVKQSLQGVSVKAQVKVDVDAQAITRAVQSAINNANFTYNPSGKGGRGGANANSAANSQRNLGNAYHYAAHGAYQSARASVSLGRSLSTNIRIAGELGTALGNLASIFGVKDLLYGIVQIGGQLENQRIALGAILQDGGKATEMFSKIQSLAVKSPFGIMDLNQYTKQLSAYGIEYNELYETMKRMADISAGVGVDMGRIILAFGQVKAAGFLKGTELRQFTEANIPMVEKLAEKFSLLERRIVSAGEVYDMISEKKVTFEDVKDVLWGLTDEGGMFNNMQEVLSESLASKWKNLSDAIDVMYGKMADGMMGSGLKALAEGLTELTKNWQTLIGVIGGAGAAYAAYKMSVALGSGTEAMSIYKQIVANQQLEKSHLRVARTYRELSAAEKGALMSKTAFTTAELRQAAVSGALTKEMALRLIAMKKISVAQAGHLKQILGITRAEITHAAAVTKGAIAWGVFKNAILGVGAALKSLMTNPWTWVFAGISAIGSAVMNWKQKSDELKQITKEIQESAKGSMQTIGKELDKLRDLDVGKLNDDELKTQINELTTLIKNEAPHWQSLLADVFKKDADGNFVRTAKEQLDGLIEKIKEVQDAKQMLSDNSELFSKALDETDEGLGYDSLVENLMDYSKTLKFVEGTIESLGEHYQYVQSAITNAAGANEKFLSESAGVKSIQEKVKILSSYTNEFAKFREELEKISPKALQMIDQYVGFMSTQSSWGSWENVKADTKVFADRVWGALLSEGYNITNLDNIAKQFIYDFGNMLVSRAGGASQSAIKDFWAAYLDQFNISYEEFSSAQADSYNKNKHNDKPKYDPSKDEVAKLWKKRAEEIDKAVKMYDKWKEVEGDINAESRVKGADEFSNLFNGKYGFSLNLENPTDAYRHIQKQLNKNLSAQNEVYIALGVKVSDAELNDAKEKVKRLIDDVKSRAKEASEQWDLYKQLFELTGNKEFAKSAFDKTQVWDDAALKMKSGLESAMKELKLDFDADFDISDKDAKELYGELYDSWKKIKDRIEKNGIELKVNTANAIKDAKDFEMQVEEIERELHEKLERIGKSGLSADVIGRLTQSLIGQSERAISSLEFDKFKKEVGYTQFFANLEHQGVHSILAMRDAMLKFGDSTNLTLEEMKQLADDIERMMDVLAKKHPFQAIDIAALAWGELRQVYKTARENFEKNPSFANGIALAEAKAGLDKADDVMLEAAKSIQSKFENLSGVVSNLSSMFERLGNTSLKHFAEELESISSGMDTGSGAGNFIGGLFGRGGAGSVVGGFIGAAVGAMVGLADAGRKAVEAEQERSQIVIDRLEKVASLLKDRIAESLTGLYNSTLDATSKIELQRKKAEYEEAAKELQGQGPIDPNAWYGISYDTTTFPWDTNDYLVYSKKTHEAIERAIDMDNEYMAIYASLLAQRDEMVYQQATYTDKDSDKVDAYKRDKNLEIEKLNAEIEKLTKDMMSSLYSIDFKDWASQLTDSIVNAWARGEDAAKAYESTVSDILRNVATSMIQQKIIGDYFEKNINPFVEDFIASGGVMTNELYYKLAGIVDGGMERIEQAEDALDAWEKVLNEKGLTLKDLSDDTTKSGLSKGIQSVTEDTADLLASYINSMRADLSMNRTLVEQLVSVDVPKMSYLAEAQLQQLQMIVSNTSKNVAFVGEIRDLFNRIIDKGSNKLRI